MESRMIALGLAVAALTIGTSIAAPDTVAQIIHLLRGANVAAQGFIVALAGLSLVLATHFFANYWTGAPVTFISAVIPWLVLLGTALGTAIVLFAAWYPDPVLVAITAARESSPIIIAKGITTFILAMLAAFGAVGLYKTTT
jgi:hypothetical protein